MKPFINTLRDSWLISIVSLFIFSTLLFITIIIERQQRENEFEKDKQQLIFELNQVYDQFRNILYSDITAANSLAVVFKQNRSLKEFDSVAKQILDLHSSAEVLQLNINGIISFVYPLKGYEETIGIDTYKDSLRKSEEEKALQKKAIYFVGPRELREGGIGILGKVPIRISNDTAIVCVVLTRISKIITLLKLDERYKGKYSFGLIKKTDTRNSDLTYLSNTRPLNLLEPFKVEIKEGDWILVGYFGDHYTKPEISIIIILFGFFVSIIVTILLIRIIRKPQALQKVIREKSDEMEEQQKFFETVVQNSSDAIVLIDKNKRVLYQSPSTEKILGYSLEEIQSLEGKSIVHPTIGENDSKIFNDQIKIPGNVWKMRQYIRHKNGNYIWIDATYKNLIHDNTIKAIVVTYADITASVLAEQNEKTLKSKLEERVKELSTLYRLNKILQNINTDDDFLFNQMVEFLPQGFQYSDICHCRITYDENRYESINFVEGRYKQLSWFMPINHKKGKIEIHYKDDERINEQIPFLEEETYLLDAVSEILTIHFNNKINRQFHIKSQERFKGAFENSNVGMGLQTLDGKWIQVNQALATMLGYTREELKVKSTYDISHPDDYEKNKSFFEKSIKGEVYSQGVKKRFIDKNGNILWGILNISVINDEKGKPDYLVAQIENITDKVESETSFQNLVENSQVGVYIIQNDKFVYVNPKMCEYTGFSKEELINIELFELIHEEDKDKIYEFINQNNSEQLKNAQYELRIQSKEKTILWIKLFGSTILYKGKNALIGTIVNITDTKIYEQERQIIIDDLTRRNRDLEQFSYIVSHNVRGPLANILGLSSMSINPKFDQDVKQKAIAGIHAAAKNLDVVLHDLNELLKMRREITENKKTISLAEKVKTAQELLHDAILKTGAKIECDFSAADEIISIRSYLINIFYNLISNGIKYARPNERPEIKIWSEKTDQGITIHFKDNGVGIDIEKNKNNLFGLYKRFQSGIEGKGIGLFMVKTQMEMMGGSIELESTPGNGCHFILNFPDPI